MERVRRASHAGSWYTNNAKKLEEELDGWLRDCGLHKSPDVRGVIAPHAGYSYSGRAAAYAFGNIDPANISRVFLLGPSHHYYTPKCALTRTSIYSTPLGDLPIDVEVNEDLQSTGKFEFMDIHVDEAEHSMEMHLPYLAKVFHGYPVKIVPILVGALNAENEAMYGRLLAKYVDDPKNFFCVSSDFCHWGARFNYTHYDKKHGAIYKSIEALDRVGMDIIETGDPDEFKRYLQEFDNTICGRHPINVKELLNKDKDQFPEIRAIQPVQKHAGQQRKLCLCCSQGGRFMRCVEQTCAEGGHHLDSQPLRKLTAE